jgi:hypothetical protein
MTDRENPRHPAQPAPSDLSPEELAIAKASGRASLSR